MTEEEQLKELCRGFVKFWTEINPKEWSNITRGNFQFENVERRKRQ